MLEVTRSRTVAAAPAAVWADVDDPARFAEWYAFCDAVDEPSPDVRVLRGSWGSRRSAVTAAITARQAPADGQAGRLAWRHTAEELDGRPAPGLAIETTAEVLLEPEGDGTVVTITSRQQAAGWWQAALARLLGRRRIADMQQQSLALLAARHAR